MSTLKMKIVGYDDASNSLLVAFASDETKFDDPAAYPAIAYQPLDMWPGVTDPEEFKKNIAFTGISHTSRIATKEQVEAGPEVIDTFKSWIGQTFTFTADDLHVQNTLTTPSHTV